MSFSVVKLERLRTACIPHNLLPDAEKAWEKLIGWGESAGVIEPGTLFIGVCHDEMVYDACMTIPDNIVPEQGIEVKEIKSGTYGSFIHCGDYGSLTEEYETESTSVSFVPGPALEIYYNDPIQTPHDQLVTEVLFPVDSALVQHETAL